MKLASKTRLDLWSPPLTTTNNNIFFREDSSEPSSNLNSNEDDTSLDTIGDNWIEVEQANRVLMLIDERIKETGYDDGVLTCDDWESII
ncbi:hypothetical protein BDB01DRAFT_770511 [Pilobolus umbonatus]|nr:hypothetical protein BDB01DRAFT_770511 [Pilobolus umbonatus]